MPLIIQAIDVKISAIDALIAAVDHMSSKDTRCAIAAIAAENREHVVALLGRHTQASAQGLPGIKAQFHCSDATRLDADTAAYHEAFKAVRNAVDIHMAMADWVERTCDFATVKNASNVFWSTLRDEVFLDAPFQFLATQRCYVLAKDLASLSGTIPSLEHRTYATDQLNLAAQLLRGRAERWWPVASSFMIEP